MDEKPKSKVVEERGKVGANASGKRTTKRKSQITIMDDISRDSSEYPRLSKVPRYGDYEVVDLFTQEEEKRKQTVTVQWHVEKSAKMILFLSVCLWWKKNWIE